ncbi:E3 ubiquitin-protein ligase Ubr3 isoform X2 [Ischnura elegans]|uniref:E3 ubiquitin-protein ligase Ubr3 isoform X2 n=1 Tax=Ischnura elegans TaxID=197161 RepID=UPI001ED88D49|nr:E3 ubiquitin-protein ligase Ubr3 isoform X2 [Ischnura elegans]
MAFVGAHVLMKKGKRGAAAYVKAECHNTASPVHLNELLDLLLNPEKAIDEWETIDWFKWLMAGGDTPDEFSTNVRRYDNATTCGLVWTANFVAYRCRTCGISPCISLCAKCFQKGNHDGHDFNMFRSQAGGVCDCGDTSVMKESGFCQQHGPQAQVNKPSAPSNLMCVAEAMMPRIILRLIQHLRENSQSGLPDAYLIAIQDADRFLTMLHDFSALGAAMRRVMTGALTNPQIYKNLTDVGNGDGDYSRYMRQSKRIYEDAVKSLPNPEPPDEYKDCPSLQEQLVHRTFLEELVFWTVKFEFPQKIVCLLLNMLPDPDYKEALTRAFVLHYSRISMMLERSLDPDTLSNRVVHVSVQLFSNEGLASRMADNLNLLHVMVISLKFMMGKILMQNTLHDIDKNFHYVVDCGRQVMKEHCYWPLVSDLNNVLSHKSVAIKFMSDNNLLEMWFTFLSMFQGMNVNQRELTQHVEFEPSTYYAAFSAELEASAYPMWAMVSHLSDASTVGLTRHVLTACLAAMQDWLDAVNFTDADMSDSFQVSFHLPLHRYFSVFMCQAIKQQGLTLKDVLPGTDMLHLMMMHPLRVQVAFYEILCGMWVRNGLQIKGQAMTYIQCNFCNSMVDADLYLLQVCATELPSETFLNTVLEKFHVMDLMSLAPYAANSFLESEHDMPMLESCLTFLASLMDIRTNLGMSDASLSQLEMVTLLCMGDKTHSQLIELMPERCGTAQSRDFESVLSEVADYRAPNLEASGNMQQGMYVPKPKVWEEMYDPIHVLLRAVHRRDFQTSMDRFTEFVRSTGQFRGNGIPWPPFRIPGPVNPAYKDPRRLLCSRFFHAIAFVILYKAVHVQSVSEHVISLTLYLLEMAVCFTEPAENSESQVCQAAASQEPEDRGDLDFSNWFESDWLSSNLRTVINRVTLNPEPRLSFNSSEGELEWESSELDGEMSESAEEELASVLMLEAGGNSGSGSSSFSLTTYDGSSSALVPTGGDMAVIPSGGPSHPPLQPSLLSTMQHPAVLAGNEIVSLSTASVSGTHSGTSTGSAMVPILGSTNHPSSSGSVGSHIQAQNHQRQIASSSLYHHPILIAVHGGEVSVGAGAIAGAVGSAGMPASTSHSPAVPALGAPSHIYPALPQGNEMVPSSFNARKGLMKKRRQDIVMPGGSGFGPKYSHNYNSAPSAVVVNESIISLLLKLHSHLSGVPDSYCPEGAQSRVTETGRIGDGPFFVGRLLDRICVLDPLCLENVKSTRDKLWPRKKEEGEDEKKEREEKEREDRRRRAKERQQKLMAEIASQQRQFMESAMETHDEEMGGMDWMEEESTLLASKKEYDCVICNQTSPSTEEKPMGLVVLVQATSVAGHKRRTMEAPILPTNEEEKHNLRQHDGLACEFDRRISELSRHFDTSSWLLSVNMGWEGGVHVQTCGHHLHLDCLKSYLHSLRSQQRQQNLAVDRGEYSCPLCRQLANSVLPLSPQLGECAAMVRSWPSSMSSVIAELTRLLQENPSSLLSNFKNQSSNLGEAMAKSMEDMTNITYMKYPQSGLQQPSPQCLFLFVSSIARTNLEVEIIQRGGTLCMQPSGSSSSGSGGATSSALLIPKRSCLVPLLHVLAVHARLLARWPTWQTLTRVAGLSSTSSSSPIPPSPSHHHHRPSSSTSASSRSSEEEGACAVAPSLSLRMPLPEEGPSSLLATRPLPLEESLALAPQEREVPLLLRDPTALLTQFILLLPLQLELRYFSCIVKVLYNLLYFQVLAQLSCKMPERKRSYWREALNRGASMDTLEGALGIVVTMLEEGQLYLEEYSDFGTPEDEGETSTSMDRASASSTAGVESGVSSAPTPVTSTTTVPGTRFRPRPARASSSGASPGSQQDECGSYSGPGSSGEGWGRRETEMEVQRRCLPFLRVAALLRHHLYGESLPEVRGDQRQSEFVRLVYFLELVTEGMEWTRFNAAVALNWACSEDSDHNRLPSGYPETIIRTWCSELSSFAGRGRVTAARSLLEQHIRWQQPRLLRLPDLYDKIFQYYHRKQCGQCHSVPREASICLLCGTLVCLKENCCKEQNVCEAVQHSIDCGAGTAMYLVVTSSYIIVIRGKRACLWGSVYLDSFGEEDRELKRGKPLYLSPGRYQLLEQQWLAHRFDHTNKKWVWHRDAL